MALYVPLSVEWADNPKLIRAGLAGRGLHALTLAIAKRLETDGWVDRLLLHREGADDELIDRLVDLRLLDVDPAQPDVVRPHNWHRHNPTQGAIDAAREAKAEAARRGNHKRWRHDGPYESCPACHPKPQVVAGCETVRDGSDPTGSPKPKTESETETSPSGPATPTPAGSAVARGKQAAIVIARNQIADRVASGAIADPQAVARKRAEEDLWPVLGDRLTAAAEEHPGATAEALAAMVDIDPLAPAGYPSVDHAAQERPRLTEVKPDKTPRPPKAVGLAGCAAARAALRRRSEDVPS